jgi:hypothetical protein
MPVAEQPVEIGDIMVPRADRDPHLQPLVLVERLVMRRAETHQQLQPLDQNEVQQVAPVKDMLTPPPPSPPPLSADPQPVQMQNLVYALPPSAYQVNLMQRVIDAMPQLLYPDIEPTVQQLEVEINPSDLLFGQNDAENEDLEINSVQPQEQVQQEGMEIDEDPMSDDGMDIEPFFLNLV